MKAPLNILEDRDIIGRIVCPHCKNRLERNGSKHLACIGKECRKEYPIVNHVPILIDDDSSLFSSRDLAQLKDTTFNTNGKSFLKTMVRRLMPQLSFNPLTKKNLERFEQRLLESDTDKVVLVVGGGIIGKGMERLLSQRRLKFIESDVFWGPRANLICDSHNLPFTDNSIDAVIIQAVLEHVIDPYRCVEEVWRVLRHGGFVYAETPFMQQVHMGRYDFTRFTHLGHRRLFRQFKEIASGPACGPAMALAWNYKYFLSSFARSRKISKALGFYAALTSFWLVYLDYFLIKKPGSYDSASSYYFWGEKNNSKISDREVLKEYKGLC